MCRDLLRIPLGGCLVLFTGLLLLLAVIFGAVLDSNYYLGVLRTANVYERMGDVLGETISELAQSTGTVEGMDERTYSAVMLSISELIPHAFSPQILQDIVERNVDNITGYLNSVRPDITIYLPKEELWLQFEALFDQLQTAVAGKVLADIPVCTEAQMQNYVGENANCIPAEVKASITAEGFASLSQGMADEFKASIRDQIFSGPDEMSLTALVGGQGGGLPDFIPFIRDGIQWVKTGIVGILALLALFWLIYALLCRSPLISRVRGTSLALIITFGVWLLLVVVLKILSSQLYQLGLDALLNEADANMGQSLILLVTEVISLAVDTLIMRLLIVFGVGFGAAALGWGVATIAQRREVPTVPKISGSNEVPTKLEPAVSG